MASKLWKFSFEDSGNSIYLWRSDGKEKICLRVGRSVTGVDFSFIKVSLQGDFPPVLLSCVVIYFYSSH